MAETTRENTTHADALMRLHLMEESLLDLWSRYRTLKAEVAALEPGGGGGADPALLARIGTAVFRGSTGSVEDPMGALPYYEKPNGHSMHLQLGRIWRTH